MTNLVSLLQQGNGWLFVPFGLSGGLIPCPASITVLLLCLQLKRLVLGSAPAAVSVEQLPAAAFGVRLRMTAAGE